MPVIFKSIQLVKGALGNHSKNAGESGLGFLHGLGSGKNLKSILAFRLLPAALRCRSADFGKAFKLCPASSAKRHKAG